MKNNLFFFIKFMIKSRLSLKVDALNGDFPARFSLFLVRNGCILYEIVFTHTDWHPAAVKAEIMISFSCEINTKQVSEAPVGDFPALLHTSSNIHANISSCFVVTHIIHS